MNTTEKLCGCARCVGWPKDKGGPLYFGDLPRDQVMELSAPCKKEKKD